MCGTGSPWIPGGPSTGWRALPSAPASDPLELLDDTLFTLSAFSGLAMESMTRGLGWRFMDMGRRVERAMNQTHLIRIGLPQVCSESRAPWRRCWKWPTAS
jgi:uncharacterized alpha-E superfamily protein